VAVGGGTMPNRVKQSCTFFTLKQFNTRSWSYREAEEAAVDGWCCVKQQR
jgi:hypothetical protein